LVALPTTLLPTMPFLWFGARVVFIITKKLGVGLDNVVNATFCRTRTISVRMEKGKTMMDFIDSLKAAVSAIGILIALGVFMVAGFFDVAIVIYAIVETKFIFLLWLVPAMVITILSLACVAWLYDWGCSV